MSNYGAIPTTNPSSTSSSTSKQKFITIATAKSKSFIATIRPWSQLTDPSTFTLPSTYTEAMIHIRKNIYHFRVNYTLIMLIILFISLIYHPISMIVFLIVFIAWLGFYFFRDEPIVVMNWVMDDRVVMGLLSMVTVVALAFTDVGGNVLVAIVVGAVVVGVHAAVRVTDDLFMDEQEAVDGGLVSVVSG